MNASFNMSDRFPIRFSMIFADDAVPIHAVLLAGKRMCEPTPMRDDWAVESAIPAGADETVVRLGDGFEWRYRNPMHAKGPDVWYSYVSTGAGRQTLPSS